MNFLKKTGVFFLGFVLFALFFYIGVSLTQTTPKVAKFFTGINNWEYKVQEQTVVYDANQKEMGRLGYQKEYSEDFPEFFKSAIVAVEDKRFYQHNGLDSKGIGRAIWTNLKAGSKAEGGSTITQQLARTLFLSGEKTWSRKIKEVFIATAIEDKYTKDAILNMYLNEIYMGRGCSGLACAAESYFGKEVWDLNQAEMTMLVGIIQAPEFYAPERNMEGVKLRQGNVIDLLVAQGLISASEGEEILAQSLNIKDFRPNPNDHPYYMAYLSGQLEEIIGASSLYQGGYKIYTTIDERMQNAAETALKRNMASLSGRGITANDAALVSVDPDTGEIKAMVGGVEWIKNQLNMAVLPRQPGSAIKPLYYAAAFDQGIISEDTQLNNKKRDFGGGYVPDNYAASPSESTVRLALVQSYNVASVEVLDQLGVDTAIDYLEEFGVTSIVDGDRNLALALGGMNKGISPLQMAAAYSVFPNNGVREETYTIRKVVDARDKIIYQGSTGSKKVIDMDSAEAIDDILKDVVRYGTGRAAAVSISSGGKTGTTTDKRDLWYLGYSSELSTAVWVGNSTGAPVTGYGSGGGVAGPIWRDYMNTLIWNRILKEAPAIAPPVEEEPTPEEPTPEEPTPEEPPAETPGEPTEPIEPEQPGDGQLIPEQPTDVLNIETPNG